MRMRKSRSYEGKYKTLSKNTLLFGLSSFGSKIISFLLVPLYTSILSTAEYGIADLITSTAALLIPILTLDIQDAVLRFAIDEKNDKKDVISTSLKINAIGALILSFSLIILKSFSIVKLDSVLLFFLFLEYILGGLNNSLSLYLKASDKVSILMTSGIINTAVMCLMNVVFLVKIHLGLIGYLLAGICGQLVAVIYSFIRGRLYRDIKIGNDKELARKMLRYSIPLIPNVLSWWINNASDRYIMTYISGVAAMGIYSVSYKIPTILSTIQNVFYNAWSISAITEYDKDDKDGFIGNIYSWYSAVSLIGCSAIMLFNIPLAQALYAKEFYYAWHYVPFLLVGTVFSGISLLVGCIFTATKQTSIISKTTIAGAVSNTIGNVILIIWIGPIGAALSTMIGYIVTWAMRLLYLRNTVSMKVKWMRHFTSLGILIIQSILAIVGTYFIYQLLCTICIIVIQRDAIIGIVKKIMHK